MGKLPIQIFPFLSFLFLFGCYEPKEACLNIDAVNYDVSADDPCADCCSFPALSLTLQHVVEWPEDTVSMRYGVYYPAENAMFNRDSFLLDRARFFISNVKLVKEDGAEVTVTDTIRLTFSSGETRTFSDNFAKLDRAFFQARKLGIVKTEGVFKEIRFTLGLEEFLQQNEITSGLPTGHPLSNTDTIIYEKGVGLIPNLLIVRHDTVNVKDSLAFRFVNPISINLPLAQPFVIERGFNIKLTLKTDYSDWFAGVDFMNDSYVTIQQKISDNLPNVFSVTEIKLE